jgi:predicted HTH transcriptional regulator
LKTANKWSLSTEPDKIAKEMIAFANSYGGKLIWHRYWTVVGVESEGEIEYIDLAAKHFVNHR